MPADLSTIRSLPLRMLLLAAAGLLGACASPMTYYELQSDPPGAQIYRGTTPESLEYYKTTPFQLNSPTSLGWSDNYFQARMPGYKDSEVRQQPIFPLGSHTRIDFVLEPIGGAAELAAYRERNTIEGYYEFLQAYPGSLATPEVHAALVALIGKSASPDDGYARLAQEHPESIAAMPDEVRLRFVGPPGMQVADIQRFLQQGIGEAVMEQKILSAGQPYSEFSFDEIRLLTSMGLSDRIIAAMLKATADNSGKNQRSGATGAVQVSQPATATMPGMVAPTGGSMPGNSLADTATDCAAYLAKKEACEQLGTFAGMVCMKAIPTGHNCF